jgi:hypothetical protein
LSGEWGGHGHPGPPGGVGHVIAYGITATEESLVNCDEVEEVYIKIQRTLDNVEFNVVQNQTRQESKDVGTSTNINSVSDEEIFIAKVTFFHTYTCFSHERK